MSTLEKNLDRLPPHSIECEQGVLGCVLLSPNDSLAETVAALKMGATAFYDVRHQAIYAALVEMYDGRVAIDIITLQQKLKDEQRLEKCGGLAYVVALPDKVPTAANLGFYLEHVKDKYLLRQMSATCADVQARILSYEGDVDELLDTVERDLLRVGEERTESTTLNMRSLVTRAIDTVEQMANSNGALTGLGTGFLDLDRMTGGLHAGEMIVIAARPSMGKTSLAMNIAEHIAVEQKTPVGVFSLEMTAESLVLRMVASRARVNLRAVRDGFISQADYGKISAAAGKLNAAPIHIDDTAGLSILQLRAKARRLAQQFGIKALVVDYLQLLHSTNRRSENRTQEVSDISNGLKALAKELRIPVIVLSQLNRELEKDKGRKPRLSDLRESGAIEQDADLVGLLYEPAADDDGAGESPEARQINLLIAKQRNGPMGDVNLTFLKPFTRFVACSPVSAADEEE